MYLGSPDDGGETTFPRANLAVKAVKGSDRPLDSIPTTYCTTDTLLRCATGDAVLFWSVHPDLSLDPDSVHGSNKVKKGVKYAATKWIRANPTYRGV
jgi:prolyl 4-hydroxylase